MGVPCLQKPRAYQGHSRIFSSGLTCRNMHSPEGLLHSPVRASKSESEREICKSVDLIARGERDHVGGGAYQISRRSNRWASCPAGIRADTRSSRPSCTSLATSACTLLCLHRRAERGTFGRAHNCPSCRICMALQRLRDTFVRKRCRKCRTALNEGKCIPLGEGLLRSGKLFSKSNE
jgi:hypothetical protein